MLPLFGFAKNRVVEEYDRPSKAMAYAPDGDDIGRGMKAAVLCSNIGNAQRRLIIRMAAMGAVGNKNTPDVASLLIDVPQATTLRT